MQGNPTSGGLSNSESGRANTGKQVRRDNAPDFTQLPSCGDFDMRISRDGTWFYRGSPIGRKPLVKLFSTVLRREDGEDWLVAPAGRGRILGGDAPLLAVGNTAAGGGPHPTLTLPTHIDDQGTL